MWWGNHFFKGVNCGPFIPGTKAKPKGPSEKGNSSHESWIMLSACQGQLTGGRCLFLSLQDADAHNSFWSHRVCLSWGERAFRNREISGVSASWFVASVGGAYSVDRLTDWTNKPQGPVSPDPSINQLWALGSREKVFISLMFFHVLCVGKGLWVKSLVILVMFFSNLGTGVSLVYTQIPPYRVDPGQRLRWV